MPKCDIIIPVWNQLQNTKDCIDSIRKNTSYPYNLIIIDNASDKDTALYLDSIKDENVTILRNKENQGFIKAVNQGIKVSSSEYVCILNNDTIVTSGWLTEMVNILDRNPSVGIVNPSSNTLGQNLKKNETPQMRAEDIKKEKDQFVELGNAFGFCMLTRKKIFNEVGLLDEVYGMGYFEDTDFSLRVKQKGYKAVRAFASYVYHKEKMSFKLLRNFDKNFKKNREIFELKWGKTQRVAVIFKKMDVINKKCLEDVLNNYAKEKSWVYVITQALEKKDFFRKNSNLTFYHFNNIFYFRALLKVLFKKKRPNIIYSDNVFFLKCIKIFIPKIDIRTIYGDA